jgi:hypothetical protein
MKKIQLFFKWLIEELKEGTKNLPSENRGFR